MGRIENLGNSLLCPSLPILLVITFCHVESEVDVELNSG